MKKELIKILCCPTCKGELKLEVEKEEEGEIITGKFTCPQCKCSYPISDGIPNLLPQET
ncbi:MAG: methytransferase partner Trm112 [Candidatus Thermoplasmatota archaeon]|nr:methytransferase partner Trm112 [Candidatus Thermoplasmatota archaeon]